MIPGQRKLELNLLWDIQLAGQEVQETITSHRHITVFTSSVQSYSISLNKGKALCTNVTFHALFQRPKLRRLTWSIYQILVAQLRCTHLGIQAQASARTQKKKGVKHKKTAAQGSKIAWAKSPSASSWKIHCTALPFTLSSFLPLRISPWQKNVPWRKKDASNQDTKWSGLPPLPPVLWRFLWFFLGSDLVGIMNETGLDVSDDWGDCWNLL